MRIYATDHFVLPLPPGHRFPMAKYARLRQRVTGVAADLVAVSGTAASRSAGPASRGATRGCSTRRARGVPVAVAMAGGCADDVDDTVDIHFATIALALERYAHRRVLEFSWP